MPADWALAFRATWHTDAEKEWDLATERPPLHPSVACAHIRISVATTSEMLQRLERVELNPLAPPDTGSFEGSTSYSLLFRRRGFSASLEWYDDGPRSWDGLAHACRSISNEMDSLLESPDASTEIPPPY